MPSGRLTKRIKQAMASLTASERSLAEFCWQHGTRLAFWSAARCAKAANVSESTVIRFARSLGYESYSDLQKDIWEEIELRLNRPIPQRLEGGSKEGREPSGSFLAEALHQDIANLQETVQICSEEDFARAIDMIATAENVYVVGLRASATLAEYLGYALNLVLPRVTVINRGADTLLDQMMAVDENSVVIVFSFARKARRTLQLVDFAKREGARVVAVTDSVLSDLASQADAILLMPTQSPAYIQSLTAGFSICIGIISAITTLNQERAMERLAKIERALADYDVITSEVKPGNRTG